MNLNLQHIFYALDVEQTGSITQTAENFYVSQPTMSKAMKDLEKSLGFSIFKRNSKGVKPTAKGREFLKHARKIAAQIEKMEQSLQSENGRNQVFNLAIPRVTYIGQAAAEFVSALDINREMEVRIMETSAVGVIDAVSSGRCVLGVVRFNAEDEDYFLKYLEEKELQYEMIWQSEYVAVMRKDHPLAEKPDLKAEDFAPYIEGIFVDNEVPYVRVSEGFDSVSTRRILLNDRAMQYDLLRGSSMAYMWIAPLPEDILRGGNLAQRKFTGSGSFKDVLVTRQGYHFSRLDKEFINRVSQIRNELTYQYRIIK